MNAFLIAAMVIAVGAAVIAARRGLSPLGGSGSGQPGRRGFGFGFGKGASSRGTRRAVKLELVGGETLTRGIDQLPEEFAVAFAVLTPSGEIPAVVLGPTGLWALAATDAKGVVGVVDGAVTVGGRGTDAASDLWRRAHALAGAMAGSLAGEVPVVQGAIVFASADAKLTKSEAMGIRLLGAGDLEDALVDSRVRYDPATLADLREALARVANTAP